VGVPKEGIGIEEAFTTAIQQWKFRPATQNGVAVPGTYNLAVNLSADVPLHIARMYPVSSPQAWEAVERAVRAMGMSAETRNEKDGVLITKPKKFLDAEDTYHIFVPRNTEPARVYIGSIRVRRNLLEYNSRDVNEFLFGEVNKILTVSAVPLPVSAVRRAQVAQKLFQSKATNSCPSPIKNGMTVAAGFTSPQLVSRVEPRYPSRQRDRGRTGRVIIEGVVAEDGFFSPTRVIEGDPRDPEFIDAALFALSLWRYRPAIFEQCATSVTMTTVVSYTIR
jgi:hypothetical protein